MGTPFQPSPIHGPGLPGSGYSHRFPIVLQLGGQQDNQCINLTIPPTWAEFWDNVAVTASGNDVRVQTPDGTEIHRVLDSWDHSQAECNLQVGGVDLGATSGAGVLWLTWGNASPESPLADPVSQDNVVTSRVFLNVPAPASNVIAISATAYGQAEPADKIQKASGESIPVWVDVTDWLSPRFGALYGESAGDAVKRFSWTVHAKSDDAVQAAMTSDAQLQYVETAQGRHLIRCWVTGGTSGTAYYGELKATLAQGATRTHRITINVQDL